VAVASPIPEPPPVTTATFPDSAPMGVPRISVWASAHRSDATLPGTWGILERPIESPIRPPYP
jgi:hypothetical protein